MVVGLKLIVNNAEKLLEKRLNMKNPQLKEPNFEHDGKIFLVRCHKCGRENYAPAVSSGMCVWCGDNANLFEQLNKVVGGKEYK